MMLYDELFAWRLGLVLLVMLFAALASLISEDKVACVLKVVSLFLVVTFAFVEILWPNDMLFIAKIGVLLIVRQIFLIWPAVFASFVTPSDINRWLDGLWIGEVVIGASIFMAGTLGAFLIVPISKLMEVIK